MNEKLKIAAHHVASIKEQFAKIESDQEIRDLAEDSIRELGLAMLFPANLPAYPSLLESENFKKAVDAKVKAVKAVLSGEYEEMQDYNIKTGLRNYDLICYACPNYSGENRPCRMDIIYPKMWFSGDSLEDVRRIRELEQGKEK